jgi:hypothetical protein
MAGKPPDFTINVRPRPSLGGSQGQEDDSGNFFLDILEGVDGFSIPGRAGDNRRSFETPHSPTEVVMRFWISLNR